MLLSKLTLVGLRPITVQVEAVAEQNLELQRQENMVFSGTAIANGTCLAVVTSTGMSTQIGRIQSSIASASNADDDTPLKRKLDEFGQQLTYVIGIVCLTLWLINYRYQPCMSMSLVAT